MPFNFFCVLVVVLFWLFALLVFVLGCWPLRFDLWLVFCGFKFQFLGLVSGLLGLLVLILICALVLGLCCQICTVLCWFWFS